MSESFEDSLISVITWGKPTRVRVYNSSTKLDL